MNPLILILGGAAILTLNMSGKRKKTSSCPAQIILNLSDVPIKIVSVQVNENLTAEISIPLAAYSAAISGERDIVKLVAKTFSKKISLKCFKNLNVTVIINDPDKGEITMTAPELFSVMANSIIDDLHLLKIFNDQEASDATNSVNEWMSGISN